ncbi:hypothetical protein PR048_020913 [Dryococelus australis]|uniref:Uncharacterized protein n=1 Tax=Dryococelus australis TaxID=614101 RepID=A0ABQ9GWR1_9NEOP|nr:hypothetical protein PR048_020913 [Dryococelus australis]
MKGCLQAGLARSEQACLERRDDEALGMRTSVALIVPSLLGLENWEWGGFGSMRARVTQVPSQKSDITFVGCTLPLQEVRCDWLSPSSPSTAPGVCCNWLYPLSSCVLFGEGLSSIGFHPLESCSRLSSEGGSSHIYMLILQPGCHKGKIRHTLSVDIRALEICQLPATHPQPILGPAHISAATSSCSEESHQWAALQVDGPPLVYTEATHTGKQMAALQAALADREAAMQRTGFNSGCVTWKSCRTMLLVGGFSRGFPIFPALEFRRCSILTSRPRTQHCTVVLRAPRRDVSKQTQAVGSVHGCAARRCNYDTVSGTQAGRQVAVCMAGRHGVATMTQFPGCRQAGGQVAVCMAAQHGVATMTQFPQCRQAGRNDIEKEIEDNQNRAEELPEDEQVLLNISQNELSSARRKLPAVKRRVDYVRSLAELLFPVVCPSVCPSVYPSVCPIVCPSVCPSVCPIVCPSVCRSVCLALRWPPGISVESLIEARHQWQDCTPVQCIARRGDEKADAHISVVPSTPTLLGLRLSSPRALLSNSKPPRITKTARRQRCHVPKAVTTASGGHVSRTRSAVALKYVSLCCPADSSLSVANFAHRQIDSRTYPSSAVLSFQWPDDRRDRPRATLACIGCVASLYWPVEDGSVVCDFITNFNKHGPCPR